MPAGLPIRPIRVNGKLFTRNSVAVRIGALRVTGVDSIDWDDDVASTIVQRMNVGGMPLDVVSGAYSCSAGIKVYTDEADYFESLVALDAESNSLSDVSVSIPGVGTSLRNLTNLRFNVTVSVHEEARTRTVVFVNAKIVGRSGSVGNDASALVSEYKLQPVLVVDNGNTLVGA